MLVTRIVTASIFLLLTTALVLLNSSLILNCFIFFVHLMILWEWLGLLKKDFFQKSLPISIFFLCALVVYEKENFDFLFIFLISAAVVFWIFIVPFLLFTKKNFPGLIAVHLSVFMTFSSFYACLWSLSEGLLNILSILLVVWIADISAYFTGRFFGKSKLAPNISPKKTWEGVFGAVIANILFAWLSVKYEFGWFDQVANNTNIYFVFFLVISATFVSVLGDLFQSLLKREAKVKDSGKLLPGHGGFYDRFDAVIAVSPFLTLSVKLTQ